MEAARSWKGGTRRLSDAKGKGLPFNNTALKKLPVDDSQEPGSRTVPAACFSRIRALQPLLRPALVSQSQSALALLGLSVQDVLADPRAPEYLSGSRLLPGSEPAAHCYSGHQFGLFAGQLGDGAVMYLGEVESVTQGRWEIQVKGAGVTPYSRDGDGRKVLRSSIREFLCSEAMAALGIPSIRAASLVTSDLYVSRDPLNSGGRIPERCSVVLRLAPSPNIFSISSELAMIISMAQTNPVMFGMVADTPAVSQQLERMGRLKELLETDQEELKKKQCDDWIHWVSRYRRRLARECDAPSDLSLIKKERLSVMNSTNPQVVLRNYIAQNAIQSAEKGDFSEVNRVLRVLEKPYSDISRQEPLDGLDECDEKHQNRRELAYNRKPPAWAQSICIT